jgi:hypothetical protein
MAGKLLLQQFWHATSSWKTPIDEEKQQRWVEWMRGLAFMEDLQVPRWYGFPRSTVLTLSACSDASNDGYGVSAYFHARGYKTAFVAAKGKVINPAKPPSIPRSELQALVLSCRLVKTIVKETESVINIGKIVFWVDSTAVYHWTRNDRARYVPFVANRLAEVHETLEELQRYAPEVRYINTTQNPADLLTRARTAGEFKEQFHFWIHGPAFFTGGEENWPSAPEVMEKEKEAELRKIFISVNTAVADNDVKEAAADDDVDTEIADDKDDVSTVNSVAEYAEKQGYNDATAEQLKIVEKKAAKRAQQAVFSKEITELKALSKSTDEGVLPSKIFNSGPLKRKEVFLDPEGMLRVITRLENANFVSRDEKNPLVLPSKHPLTGMLIRDYHRQVGHHGSKTTFAAMARSYYVPFSAVSNVVYKCQHCRERTPIPVKFPQAALHENRLQMWGHAFESTGMDHFGPFEIQRSKKIWGLLLICLTTGAVHLEPVDSLTVSAHLNALDRFIARRGKPSKIRSDKGRTFIGGSKEYNELTKILAEEMFQGELAAEAKRRWGITFEFNIAYTPQHGGRWERMVKEFKRSLSKAADSVAQLRYDALATLLIRAEGFINQRPIAITDDLRVITPMQLLQPASAAAFGFEVGQSISRTYEQVRQSVDYFWRHWRSHYLTLMSVERLTKGNPRFINLAVGDKVLLRDNFKSSNIFAQPTWVPVKVTETFPSADGAVRLVKVEKANGEELTLTTDKLAIVEEDLLDRYRKSQGLQTVNQDSGNTPSTLSEDVNNGDKKPAADLPTKQPSTMGRRGRPQGAKNRRWEGDSTRYSLRSRKPNQESYVAATDDATGEAAVVLNEAISATGDAVMVEEAAAAPKEAVVN